MPSETRVVIFDAGRQGAAISRRREPVCRDVETVLSVVGVFATQVGVFADLRDRTISLPLDCEVEVRPFIFSRLPEAIDGQPAPFGKNIWRFFADRSGAVQRFLPVSRRNPRLILFPVTARRPDRIWPPGPVACINPRPVALVMPDPPNTDPGVSRA